jgi:simple sugar transport system substrate-binding protein
MKKSVFLLAVLLFPFQIPASPKVAVLDVVVSKEIDPSVIVPVTETIMEELVSSRAFTVLDRSFVAQVLKEKEFQVSGLVSDTQIVQVGQYLGADYVIAGRAQYVADSYFLVAKMIDVKTGVITAQSSETGQGKVLILLDLARSVGGKLAGGGGPAAGAATAAKPAQTGAGARLSVGFIFGDQPGWQDVPYPGEAARRFLEEKHKDWLSTFPVYRVEPPQVAAAVDRLVKEQGCRLIITPDSWLRFELASAARNHPEVLFAANSWTEDRPPNFGTFGMNDMPGYYLTGLLAGALTKSGKIAFPTGFLGAYGRGVVNMFALGVKAVNPKATIIVRFLGEGYWNPDTSRPAEEALIREGCDVFAPADPAWLFETIRNASSPAKRIHIFGVRMPWQPWRDIAVTGPWEDWRALYEKIVLDARNGTWSPEYVDWGIRQGALKLGGMGEPLNPDVLPLLAKVRVTTPDLGTLPLPELVFKRTEQMRVGAFEPFTGPIRDQAGKVRIKSGERLNFNEQDWGQPWTMDWLVDNVKGTVPAR